MRRFFLTVCLCLAATPVLADGVWDPEDLQQMMKDRRKELEQQWKDDAKNQRHWTSAEIETLRQKYTVPPGPYYIMSQSSSGKIINRAGLDVIHHYGIDTRFFTIYVVRNLPGDWFACGVKYDESPVTGMYLHNRGFIKSSDGWILYRGEVPEEIYNNVKNNMYWNNRSHRIK